MKKKSLVGYVSPGWKRYFKRSDSRQIRTLSIHWVKGYLEAKKVKITIEEIQGGNMDHKTEKALKESIKHWENMIGWSKRQDK